MIRTHQDLEALQRLIVDVSRIERRHFRPQTERRENVAEHSLSVAALAWYLHGLVSSATDLNIVLRYAMVHDFVEVYAGDVNTFASPAARAEKELREAESLERLAQDFAQFPDLVTHLRAYQAMDDAEARFVWTTDKIQQLIMGGLDHWRCYAEVGISRARFDAKMAELLAKSAPELRDVFAGMITLSQQSYWDGKPE